MVAVVVVVVVIVVVVVVEIDVVGVVVAVVVVVYMGPSLILSVEAEPRFMGSFRGATPILANNASNSLSVMVPLLSVSY